MPDPVDFRACRIESPTFPDEEAVGPHTPRLTEEERRDAFLESQRPHTLDGKIMQVVTPTLLFIGAAFLFLPTIPACLLSGGALIVGGVLIHEEVKEDQNKHT